MPNSEIELNPVDFVTVGTVGPKGQRVFYLQAAHGDQIVSLIIEKEQARALSQAIGELLDDLNTRYPDTATTEVNMSKWDMSLHDPIDPFFRVSQMGLGYDEDSNRVVLIAQELVIAEDEGDLSPEPPDARVVRMWATREQMSALSQHAQAVVKQGRANPKNNGNLTYYWK